MRADARGKPEESSTPFAEVGLLDEAHGGEDGTDVVQAALHCDLRLCAPSRRHINTDQRHGRVRQRNGALHAVKITMSSPTASDGPHCALQLEDYLLVPTNDMLVAVDAKRQQSTTIRARSTQQSKVERKRNKSSM